MIKKLGIRGLGVIALGIGMTAVLSGIDIFMGNVPLTGGRPMKSFEKEK